MMKRYPNWLRGVLCNHAISQKQKSALKRDGIDRVKIGANVVSAHFATRDLFHRNHPLGRHATPMEPHGNHGLTYWLASDLGQLPGESRLAASHVDHDLKCVDSKYFIAHFGDKDNTESVLDVNTQSVNACKQTRRMPKEVAPSPFWRRLTEARESCKPPKDMNQTAVGKDYGAKQAAVTKWCTGGPKRDHGIYSLPEPEKILKMAIDTNVCTDWLWSGRGDMRPMPATHPKLKTLVDLINETPADHREKVLTAAIMAVAAQKMARDNPRIASALDDAEKSAKKMFKEISDVRKR